MKTFIIPLLTLAFVPTLSLAADSKQDNSATEQAITKLEESWLSAVKSGDAKAVDESLADDFTMGTPNGQEVGKDQFLNEVREHALTLTSAKIEDPAVRVYGDAAVVTGVMTIAGKQGDNDLSGSYRFTDTLVKHEGKWQKVAQQLTRVQD
jgi:uncharacterized protein (TIGR02246 family)